MVLTCESGCEISGYVLEPSTCNPGRPITSSGVYPQRSTWIHYGSNLAPAFSLIDCSNCVCDVVSSTEVIGANGIPEDYYEGTGQYKVRYISTQAGHYSMDIRLTALATANISINAPIGNATTNGASPYDVYIEPAEYSAAQCIAYGLGTTTAIAGEEATFWIQPRDQFGNNGTADQTLSATFTTSILDAGEMWNPPGSYPANDYFSNLEDSSLDEDPPITTHPSDSTVFQVAYSITAAGYYSARVVLEEDSAQELIRGGTDCSGSNCFLQIQVHPAAASVGTTRITSNTLATTIAALWPAATPSDTVCLYGPHTDAGSCPAPTESVITVPILDGVPAGTTGNFTVSVFDNYDNLRDVGADEVTAELQALSGTSITAELMVVLCNVTDLLSGEYLVEFTALRTASYDVMLNLNAENVRNPPFKARVVAAARFASQCTADGAGIVGGQHESLLAFIIYAKDIYGNLIDSATNQTFLIEMQGVVDGRPVPSDLTHVLVDVAVTNKGLTDPALYGQYEAVYIAPDLSVQGTPAYVPLTIGPWLYSLAVMVPGTDQTQLLNSELSPNQANTEVTGWQLYADGSTLEFVSDPDPGGARSSVVKLMCTISDCSGKSHMWQTFPTTAGERYRIKWDVWMNPNTAIHDTSACPPSYFQDNEACVLAGDYAEDPECGCWGNAGLDVVDATMCTASYIMNNQTIVDGDSTVSCWEQHSSLAFVTPSNDDLVSMSYGAWVTMELSFVAVSSLSTIRLHFTPQIVGEGDNLPAGGAYFDKVVVDTHIASSPFTVTTVASFQPSVAVGIPGREGTTAAGDGISGSTAGTAVTLTITPRNPLGLRQDPTLIDWQQEYFAVSLDNGDIDDGADVLEVVAPVFEDPDDLYYVTYVRTQTGMYSLSIILDTPGSAQRGMHIDGSPFNVSVVSGPAVAHMTQAVGIGLETCVAGESAYFTVQTRDTYGNIETDLPSVGIGDQVTATLSHISQAELVVEPVVTRIANGTVYYDAEYVATFAGLYDLAVLHNGQQISGPWQVDVTPASTHAATCEIGGAGLAGSVAGQPSNVELQAKDQFGNPVPDEPEEFHLQ